MQRSLDYHVDFFKEDGYLESSYEAIRILYIMNGSCQVHMGSYTTILQKADFFLLNILESIVWYTQNDLCLAVLSFDYDILCQTSKCTYVRYSIDSSKNYTNNYAQLRWIIQTLLHCWLGDRKNLYYLEQAQLNMLIYKLSTSFLVNESDVGLIAQKEEIGVHMLKYIQQNYKRNLSVNEIAQRFYLSQSSASRFLQQVTRMHFRDYLRKLRLEAGRTMLLNSSQSISWIAMNCGFSTPSMFTAAFRKCYGLSPSIYRKQKKLCYTKETIKQFEKKFLLQMLDKGEDFVSDGLATINLSAHLTDAYKSNIWHNRLLVVGQLSWLRFATMQRQVLFLQDKLKIQYIQVWNPFASDLMILNSDGRYNFGLLDDVFDFCVDHQLKLVLELTLRDEMVWSNEKTVLYNVDEWKKYDDTLIWEEALHFLMKHLLQRYRKNIINQWVFSMEIFLSRHSHNKTEEQMLEMWTNGNRIIRSYLPEAIVAGPGMSIISDKTCLDHFHDCLFATGFIPDIYTITAFPYKLAQREMLRYGFEKDNASEYIENSTKKIIHSLESYNFKGRIWMNAWGISISSRNYLQDSSYRGAFMLATAFQLLPIVESLGIFVASDLITAFSDSEAILYGGTGILTRDGIPKPIFYAWLFFSKLGSYTVLQNRNCIITMESSVDIRILCWNNKSLGAHYYLTLENAWKPEQIQGVFDDYDHLILNITLKDLEKMSTCRIRQQIVNCKDGSLFTGWVNLGCPDVIDREDVQYLERISVPKLLSNCVKIVNGILKIQVNLAPNEIRYLHIISE